MPGFHSILRLLFGIALVTATPLARGQSPRIIPGRVVQATAPQHLSLEAEAAEIERQEAQQALGPHGLDTTCGGICEFWVVNTREAPVCPDLAQGIEKITYWHVLVGKTLQPFQQSREEFLLAIGRGLPITFHVHGNGLSNEQAMDAVHRINTLMHPLASQFTLVIWSWPAEHIKGAGLAENLRIKAARADAQGFYLAWLIDQIDPRAPLSLTGHSYGARTVVSGLQALAVEHLCNAAQATQPSHGCRPIQAALIAGAMENSSMLPGRKYELALTQVERMLITYNCEDLTLRIFQHVFKFPCLGITGLASQSLAAELAMKIEQFDTNPYLGRSHFLANHVETPLVADRLRPYFAFLDAPSVYQPGTLEEVPAPRPTREAMRLPMTGRQ